jgi:hypothetical protein
MIPKNATKNAMPCYANAPNAFYLQNSKTISTATFTNYSGIVAQAVFKIVIVIPNTVVASRVACWGL